MKKLNLLIVATVLLFTACDYNGQNFPDFDSNRPIDIKTLEYTMLDADYKAIADNRSNQTLATNNGVRTELSAVETQKAFNPSILAQDYAPALLATLYPTADESSAIRLTYKYRTSTTGFYRLSANDYTQIWDGVSSVGSLTPSKSPNTILPAIMAAEFPAAKDGDVKFVEYEYSAIEPGQNMSTMDALSDDFESYSYGTGVAVQTTSGFLINKDVKGARTWECRMYSNNRYAQVTANGSNEENEVWLVTRKIDLTGATDEVSFTFDITAGYVNANNLFILVSENFDGTEAGIATASWTDVSSNFTIPDGPASGYGTLGPAGVMDFKAYAGKSVYIAFKYDGNGIGNVATTTYQIDNVEVSYTAISTVVGEKETRFAYAKYANGTWTLDNAKSFYQLTAEDYAAMGRTTIAAADAPDYLPAFLQQKYPYAQPGDAKVVAYRTSTTANNADEYVYEDGIWVPESFIEIKTDQFVKTGGKWVYNPSVTIHLSPIRNEPTIVSYYQAAVDWVWENIDVPAGATAKGQGYVTSFANDDKYGGMSAYYNNIDWRAAAARTQMRQSIFPNEYPDDWTEEQVQDEMKEHLIAELGGMLTKKHPEAVPISGIEVIYTINVPIFTGVTVTQNNYTLQYKVVGQGEFEYVPDSFQPL